MDKKLLKYVGIVAGVIILIIIILVLFNSATGATKYTYEKIETKLVNAAKNYVSDKKKQGIDVLPESPLADPYYVSANILESNGYIKNISEMAKDEVTCVGGVNVYNAGGGNYDYVPDLKCGSFYEAVSLADKVISDNDNGITHGSGLYIRSNGEFIVNDNDLNSINADDFEYVFRGDEVNNYVKIDDNVWRIVSIDNNNDISVSLSWKVLDVSVLFSMR